MIIALQHSHIVFHELFVSHHVFVGEIRPHYGLVGKGASKTMRNRQHTVWLRILLLLLKKNRIVCHTRRYCLSIAGQCCKIPLPPDINKRNTMRRTWDEIVDFCQKLTWRIEKDLLSDFGKVKGKKKKDGSLVTIADKRADLQIRQAIHKAFPTHGILTEEGEEAIFPENEWCWIVDPLDGTHNFVNGIPIWGISLGLLHLGEPVFGYLYFPPLQQNYHGFFLNGKSEEGPDGAFFNDKALPSCEQKFEKNQFFTFCSRSIHVAGKNFPCKVRVLGSCAYDLVAVAGGGSLGTIELKPKIWDFAGAFPIIRSVDAYWYFLQNDPFPLQKGKNYLHEQFPLFVIARKELKYSFLKYAKLLT